MNNFKKLTNWELYLSLVTDVEAKVHLYTPDDLAKSLSHAQEQKYLTLNEKLIFPSHDNFGFEVKVSDHQSRLTNSNGNVDLSEANESDHVLVSLIYQFKRFSSFEMTDKVIFGELTAPGRIIDLPESKLELLLDDAKKDFAEKLQPFGVQLEKDKTYLRFFLY